MRFSKRPQPADFGSDGEAADLGARAQEAEPLGLRPLKATGQDNHMTARTHHAVARVDDDDATDVLDLEAETEPPGGWLIWLIAFAVAILWALGPIAFALGYRAKVAPLQDDPFALLVFALLAIGPAAFVVGAAYMIRQGQKLAFESRRAQAMAQDMLAPALVAAARAGEVTQGVREEIVRAGRAADEARETLAAMRDALAFETDKLTGATAQSVRTANELADTLGRERSQMSGLAQTLDAQATRVADAVTQQARMVTEAAGMAETQIREAEAGLSARAADLAAAAGGASDAARAAGEDLTRHIARLETAGAGVADQVRDVEAGLSQQRTALASLSQALKADHDAFAGQADAHAGQLGAFIADTRIASTEMSEQAASGGAALRTLMSDVTLQFRDLAETARAEREEFGQSTRHALEAVSAAAADRRAAIEEQTRSAVDTLAAAAEEARAATERHAAAARDQVDQLSEAAFSAGQKANQVFERRLEEARTLLETSTKLVEDAGAANARKLEEGAAAARASLDELSGLLFEVETRAAELPATVREQAEQVHAAVAAGLDDLRAQARRTAEEAQAIDVAFQERVRRNFEMLSEAMRLMGTAALSPAAPLAAASFADPASRAVEPAPTPDRKGEAAPLATTPESRPAPVLPDSPMSGAALPGRIGLRSRLRFTPTATDQAFTAVFEAAGGLPLAAASTEADADDGGEDAADAWTWKDLLASLDSADGDGQRLEDLLGAELSRMGIDAGSLLPKIRVNEIAAAVQTGDIEGAREVVRKVAPAATRRIARRLFTDEEIKRRTEVYVRRYRTLINDAIGRDAAGYLLADLLNAEPGRTFLLLEAAAGDMI